MIELKTKINSYSCRTEVHDIFCNWNNWRTHGNPQQRVEFESKNGHKASFEFNGHLPLEGSHDTTYFITIETEKERDKRLNEVKVQTISIFGCARCGKTHKDLEIKKLSNSDFSHWAQCPTNGEPILVKFETTEEEICDTIP